MDCAPGGMYLVSFQEISTSSKLSAGSFIKHFLQVNTVKDNVLNISTSLYKEMFIWFRKAQHQLIIIEAYKHFIIFVTVRQACGSTRAGDVRWNKNKGTKADNIMMLLIKLPLRLI